MIALVNRVRVGSTLSLCIMFWGFFTGMATYSGPFGTYIAMDSLTRLGFWGAVIGYGICVSMLLRRLIRKQLPHISEPSLAGLMALGSAAAVPPLVTILSWQLIPHHADRIPPWYGQAALVFMIVVSVVALRCLVLKQSAPVHKARLLDRIEPALRGPVWHLCAGNHYVDVTTDKGASKLLMRFSDALAELEPDLGLQVHRSHWVAFDAVACHRSERGRLLLRLRDGTEVPVSRKYRGSVKQADLLRAQC